MAGTHHYSPTHHDSGRGYHRGHGFRKVTADELAAEAMAADMDKWITYVPSEEMSSIEPFEEWLLSNLPSDTSRLDGVGWVHVTSPFDDEDEDEDCDDVIGAQESFEKLKSSGRPINRQTITELAKMHSITTGKWLFYTSSGLKVNHLWSLVARGVVSGQCGTEAKVSSYNPEAEDDKHVVCVYNKDFTNHEEVLDLENSIRKLGIKCSLMYKPDIYTYLGIYRNNEWSLPPTIYRSVFDLLKGCSKISETATFHEMANFQNSQSHSPMDMVD